jgi:hypothetical protein
VHLFEGLHSGIATMATKPTPPSPPPGTDPFEALYLSDDQLHEYERHRAAQVEQQRKVKPAFQLPVVSHVFTPVAARPPAPTPAPRQALGAAEAAAWRHVVHVLSKTANPKKREIMADNVDDFIFGRSADEPGIELADVATLFHPDSPEEAAAVLAALQRACEADALPSDGDCVHLSQLAAWPDIPAPAADSPLRFWLPFLPQAAAPVLKLVPSIPVSPTTWSELVAYRNSQPGQPWTDAQLSLLAAERTKRGVQPGAAAEMAANLCISVSALNKQINKGGSVTKRQRGMAVRTGTL